MRIALIADIHGNVVALDEVNWQNFEKKAVDQIVCLGDVAAGGPWPAQTLERLRELDCPVVMGNADQWLLTPQNAVPSDETLRWFSDIGSWCRNRLSDEQLSYIESFVPTFEQRIDDDATILCYHGSPRSNTEHLTAMTPGMTLTRYLQVSTLMSSLAGTLTSVVPEIYERDSSKPRKRGPSIRNRARNRSCLQQAGSRVRTASRGERRVDKRLVVATGTVRRRDSRQRTSESDMPHADQWLEDWKVEN